MRKNTNDNMSRAIAERLQSQRWAESIGQKVETERRLRARSRSRLFVAMCLFVVAGFFTADELLDDDSDAENMYTMVEQVTFSDFSGRIVE
ncbi:hypothetical protein [Turneriella parva]|uniref:Uncharacterized protein n=1 Tax=Turneriella parva (strain ATCC BAA-1111 / DSM 21527 / NCTC 11395 / H) TaxID=869212 RepID=I4B7T3_TURPD|nr:hypothetical protein [Turneriella parva]AFM13340.1 hypothetical protein Turpa_2701 [Turneriella parva DSM 21527]